MNVWQTAFDEARNTPAWKGIFPARRENILYTREVKTASDKWVFRDLCIDLQTDVAQRLAAADTKPMTISIFADTVYVPKALSMTLKNIALIIVARTIEVPEPAILRLDFSNTFGASLMLFTNNVVGDFKVEALMSKPEQLPVTPGQAVGVWFKYDHAAQKTKVVEPPALLGRWFENGSPLWLMAVSAFQMATVLVTPSVNRTYTPEQSSALREKAIAMLDFIQRCAKDAPQQNAEWQDLLQESKALSATITASASAGLECAQTYARLLNRQASVQERQRKLKEIRRATDLKNQAPSYEIVKTKVLPPKPEEIKYIRHGAQTIGVKELNGWTRPVRRVTLSGVEIELDELDRSGFLKTYAGQKDIQELCIHADTLVIKTKLQFPQTDIFIYCRELYFEGADACLDTQPVATEYRGTLTKDGLDGAKAGDIFLYVQRFATTEEESTRHFRAVGGKGQDPDEGDLAFSFTQRHLVCMTKDQWDGLFSYTNRKVNGSPVTAPEWSQYKDYQPATALDQTRGIVYAELKVDGHLVDSAGTKDGPGIGGKGPIPGKPGTGGAGGNLSSTLPEQLASYADLSGGISGTRITSTKGGWGGTPDAAYWFLFENKQVNGKTEFVPTIEKQQATAGPDGPAGPEPREPTGTAGSCTPLEQARVSPWLTAINLKTAVQFAKNALASGNADLAREFLSPYLEGLEAIPATDKDDTLLQMEEEVSSLVEQAIQNVDYFGNPPGWVPMLSLESAVKIYQSILKSSIGEIYTAYYLQKAWQAKEDRQAAVQNLLGLLTKNTETTQKALFTTRGNVITTIQALRQLNVEIEEKLLKPLGQIERRLRDNADYLSGEAEKMAIISASFKIFAAVAKAIPLPEPYQMAAGAVGTVFDVAGDFVKDGGFTDSAFGKLKSGVNDFVTSNTDNFVEQSAKGMDDALLDAKKDINQLKDKADVASRKKDDLQGAYDEKKKTHDELVKKEKELLDKKRDLLLYGRGQRKKEEEAELVKGFKAFEEKQKSELDGSTTDYKAQAGEVTKVESEIKRKETALKDSQALVEKAKKDNAAKVKKGIEQVKKIAAGVETIGKTVNELMVSRSQLNSAWDKTLAKLMLNDKEFQEVTSQLAVLNQRKTALATQLLALKTSLGQQSNQISNNLLAINVLGSQLGGSQDALDPAALAYVQSISHEAHQTLMQFLYYVVKAYEYYTVEPWGKLDQGAQKLFESLQNVLEPSDQITGIDNLSEDEQKKLQALLSKPVSFKESMLTQDEFKLLTIVYEKPLRDMGKRLASQLASGSGRLLKEAPKIVTLGKEQLHELNGRIRESIVENTIPVSLTRLRQIDETSEKQRIGNIKVVKVQCRKLGKAFPDSITFKVSHCGKSVVRAQGKLFAFEPEGGREEERGQQSRVVFNTRGGKTADDDWVIEKEIGILQGKALWQPTTDRQENLLTQFLSSDAADAGITLSEFRPGVFSDFELTVEISPPECRIELEEIRLQITTEAGEVPKGQKIICVNTSPDLAIPITTSLKDMSDCSGGLGNYVGVFQDMQKMRVSVPERYGNYVHTGWCIDGETKPHNGQNYYEVSKSSYLVAHFEEAKPAPK
ncbi:hypothetical protein EJA72_07540 [Pseudomonas sp. PB120]|uniref:hypothetical protein n=1 Tax=Pseudomonas sp. PB120 TaxID=2494700 RepID=UPI0012FD78A8|nr:hypothetical protein [Pseudomonas sp. PB120]MVV48097.1 hypothetical protein [Pseudomonas sp. PB120]